MLAQELSTYVVLLLHLVIVVSPHRRQTRLVDIFVPILPLLPSIQLHYLPVFGHGAEFGDGAECLVYGEGMVSTVATTDTEKAIFSV